MDPDARLISALLPIEARELPKLRRPLAERRGGGGLEDQPECECEVEKDVSGVARDGELEEAEVDEAREATDATERCRSG